MNSKIDRLNSAIINIEAAIKYYLEDIETNHLLNKVSNKDYYKTINDLKNVHNILRHLKCSTPVRFEKLDRIRVLNLSISKLYDGNDYDLIYLELMNTNNRLCNDEKEKDRKMIGRFKQSFNSLSNYYQYRLRKAELTPSGDITFVDKKHDNYQFITENYLLIKYNFKKIKYELASISDLNNYRIDVCDKMINSDEISDDLKKNLEIVKNYIKAFATAEVILQYLNEIKLLCDEDEYNNIMEKVNILIKKYEEIYLKNKEQYQIEINNNEMLKVIENEEEFEKGGNKR